MRDTFDKALALRLLRERGIVKAILEFSGGNDEGGVDSATYYAAPATPDVRGALGLGEEVTINRVAFTEREYNLQTKRWERSDVWKVQTANGERLATPQEVADGQISEACEAAVYSRYGGFAGEYEVSGTVTFDVPAGTVILDESMGVREWRTSQEEL